MKTPKCQLGPGSGQGSIANFISGSKDPMVLWKRALLLLKIHTELERFEIYKRPGFTAKQLGTK